MKYLIFLPLLFFSCQFGQQEKEPTIYHIPSTLRGEVVIVYDFENGEANRYSGSKRLLEISEEGKLRTQNTISYGLSNDEFFLISTNGSKQRIDYEINTKSDTSICIYNFTTGTLDINGKEYEYEAFMVCRKDSVSFYNDFHFDL